LTVTFRKTSDPGRLPIGRYGLLFRRRARRARPRTQHNRRSPFDLHRVADLHGASLAQLDLAIDSDTAAGDQHFGLTAALDAASELENLGQVNRPLVHRDRSRREIIHRIGRSTWANSKSASPFTFDLNRSSNLERTPSDDQPCTTGICSNAAPRTSR
jgi:hypothetical protein